MKRKIALEKEIKLQLADSETAGLLSIGFAGPGDQSRQR